MGDAPRRARGLDSGFGIALVISECQRGILDPDYAISPGLAEQAASSGVLSRISDIATAFRASGCPVIHAHLAIRPDFQGYAVSSPLAVNVVRNRRMVSGTPQVEPMPEVRPTAGDFISTRHSGLAMWESTNLDLTLRALQVQTVVLVGVSTNVALPAAAVGATDRGYRVVLVEDAAAAATREQHEWMMANFFPLVSTVCDSRSVLAAVSER